MNIRTTLLGAITACTFAFSASAETLTLVNADSIGSAMDRMNLHFADLVKERSNGEIEINYISGNQLGTPPQVMDQISAGVVDAMGTAGSWLTAYAPDTQILTWGFTFRDADHVFSFFDSDLFQDLTTDMRETGRIRVLSAGPTEPRVAFLAEPLAEGGDFANRKMRIPQIPSYLELWKAVGAQPTQVAWSEVYLAMNTGVVDGAEAPPSAAISQRFHEVAPHVYLTNHVWATSTIVINEDKFASFSPEQQEILVQSAKDSAEWIYKEATSGRDGVLDEMKAAGATVYEFDATDMQATAQGAVGVLEAEGLWRKGLFDEVQKQ